MSGVAVPKETAVITQGTDYVRTEIMRQDITLMTYPTKEVGGRFCIPANGSRSVPANNTDMLVTNTTAVSMTNISNTIIDEEEYSTMMMLIDTFKDVCNAWSVLLFMIPVSMAVGYGYIFVLRYCARLVLNLVMACLILGSAGLSGYCLFYIGDHPSREQDMFGKYTGGHEDAVTIIGMCSAVLCFFLLCAGYAMLNRMDKISAVVQAAGDAMWSVQLLLCMPVLEVILKVVYTLVWMYFASYVISNGDIKGNHIDIGGQRIQGLVRSFSYSAGQQMMIVLYCIGYIWGLEFITMLFKFVVSYAVASWYFQPCRGDMSKPELQPDVWKQGFTYAIVYHMGSLCIGAAVIIVLYVFIPINIVNEFLVYRATTSHNPVVEALVYSCSCFVKCTEEVVSYVNKGAIVEMVLRGDMGFFASASSASRVMHGAESSVLSLHGVTLVFQIIGLVSSAAIGAYTTFWFTSTVNIYTDRRSDYFVEDRVGITIIASFIAMAVSTVFMWTVELVSDSLLFCWLVEGEDDRTHTTYAPKALRNIVMFEDANPLKDSRLISGAGNFPYDGMTSHSRHNSPDGSMHSRGDGRHNSPDKERHGGWASSPTNTSYVNTGGGHGRH